MTTITHTENEILAQAQAGDEGAFAELYRLYNRRIYRLALKITHNPQDAEDVVQTAFLKAFTHLGQFRRESRFSTWLTRIAVNEALAFRRGGPTTRVSLDDPAEIRGESSTPREIEDGKDDAEERYSKLELQELLSRVAGKLEPTLRLVFILRYVQDLSTEATARQLGLSVSAVKSRLLRACLMMRRRLSEFADGNSFLTLNREG
jgi:RNA polymerase sigma-70 factor, ECF subfamily